MQLKSESRRKPLRFAILALLTLFLASITFAAPATATPAKEGGGKGSPKPAIVLVHGAFADASGWSDVIERLQREGHTVYAPPNTLRGVASDSEYLRAFLSTITGPVVLVGHSYGGALITNAATGNRNVKALVYIAAYALDEGESVQQANALGGGHTDVVDHLIFRPFPGASEGDQDAYIDPAYFHRLFAQDLSKNEAAVMAASQRPGALASLVTPSGVPAWKTIPSWYMVASNDNIIPPEAERAMAKRAGAKTVEIKSSHVPMMSQPKKVVDLILSAVKSTRK
ncbi:pimeloyl-ACP methyl ester carboxylesterase [Mycetocola sp. CAN_C7]|uniref:alpha/beta fold hydrolase n=1 Tax=Mycetocola sp. CAN_C7 TaxID=2787724 RepID=UPI0018C98CD5